MTIDIITFTLLSFIICRIAASVTMISDSQYRQFFFQVVELFSWKVVLKKICYFHRKTPVFEPLFNKAAIRPSALLEKGSTTGFFCQYYKTFKNIYFVEHLQTAATVIFQNYFTEYLKEAALRFNIFQFCLF